MAQEKILAGCAVVTPLDERLRALWQTPQPPDLGPGPRAGITAEPVLRTQFAELTRPFHLPPRRTELLLGSLLWWHDHLDATHGIAQQIPDADGSYLHALMHRREPDYANAGYWFRRAGLHPVLAPLGGAAGDWLKARGETALAERLVRGGRWDAFAFLALCEVAAREPTAAPRHQLARELQRLEFEVWFRHLSQAV